MGFTAIVAIAVWWIFRPQRIEISGKDLVKYDIPNPGITTQGTLMVQLADKVYITRQRQLTGGYQVDQPIVVDTSKDEIWIEIAMEGDRDGAMYELSFNPLQKVGKREPSRKERLLTVIANTGHFNGQGERVYPYYLITSKNRVLYGYDGHGGMGIWEKPIGFSSPGEHPHEKTSKFQAIIDEELAKINVKQRKRTMLRKFRFSLLGLMIFTTAMAIATWWVYSPRTITISASEIEEYAKRYPPLDGFASLKSHLKITIRFRAKRDLWLKDFQYGPIVVDAESLGLWVNKPVDAEKDQPPTYFLHSESNNAVLFGGYLESPIAADEKIVKLVFPQKLPMQVGNQLGGFVITSNKRCYALVFGGQIYGLVEYEKYDEKLSEIPASHPAFQEALQVIKDELAKS